MSYKYIFEFILLLLLILGNSTVVWIIKTNNNLRNKANVFVAILASADLCFGLCTIILTITGFIYPWYTNPIACTLGGIINTFFASLGNITLCFVSIDRMIFVRKPSKYQENCRFSRNALSIVYILLHALCFAALPPLWGTGKFTHYAGTTTCLLDLSEEPIFGYITIIYGTSSSVFRPLLYASRGYSEQQDFKPSEFISASFAKKPNKHDSTRRVLRDPKRGLRKTSKTLSMMVILQFTCWTPFIVIQLISLYTECPRMIVYNAWLLILAKSALEPWVYGMYNPAFRRSVRRGVAFFYCSGRKLRRFGILSNRIRVYQVSPYVWKWTLLKPNFKHEYYDVIYIIFHESQILNNFIQYSYLEVDNNQHISLMIMMILLTPSNLLYT